MTDPMINTPTAAATSTNSTIPGFFSQILNTLINPAAALAAVPQQSGRHLWLLAIQVLLTTAIIYWFYAGMSPAWLVEQQILHAGELTPAETEQIRAAMAGMASATPIIGAVSVAIGSLAFTAIIAGYLLLTGTLQKALNYGQWFALVVWSQLPTLLNILGLAVLMLLSDSPDQPLMLVKLCLPKPTDAGFTSRPCAVHLGGEHQCVFSLATVDFVCRPAKCGGFQCQACGCGGRYSGAADFWPVGIIGLRTF